MELQPCAAKRPQCGSRQAALKELKRLSVTDKLTGIHNRSKLDNLLATHIHLADSLRLFISDSVAIQGKPLTLSFGVTEVRKHSSANEVIRQADEALYAAKGAGRNSGRVYQAVA